MDGRTLLQTHILQVLREILRNQHQISFDGDNLKIFLDSVLVKDIRVLRKNSKNSEDYRNQFLKELVHIIKNIKYMDLKPEHRELDETKLILSHYDDRIIMYGLYSNGKTHILDLIIKQSVRW